MMKWLTAKSTQDEEASNVNQPHFPEIGNPSLSSDQPPHLPMHHDHQAPVQLVHDAPRVAQQPIQSLPHGLDDDVLLGQKMEQLQYELQVCKQLGREAEGRRIEERKRLQANLDSKRQDLARTLQRAKTNISYFEYCRMIRQSFDVGEESESLPNEQQQQQQKMSAPRHRSWYGWCEGFLLRGIHHAMMTKDQLDIVQRNCNVLLMEVYADRLPRLKNEKEMVEKTWTNAIIQMEQYLARRQHFQQRSLELRQQLQKHYSGPNEEKDSIKVGPPASSPHTPCMGIPSKGILKNSSGKSTSRWEEDRLNSHQAGLSPPTRQRTHSSWSSDDDDDDDYEHDGAESHDPSLNVPGGSSSLPILSSPPALSLQPTTV